MKNKPESPFLRPARAALALASHHGGSSIPVQSDVMPPAEIGQLLARLMADESALYAITRDWRYDSAGRRFLRLHMLLDEQFTEIGRRLVVLAACSRDLNQEVSTGHRAAVSSPRGPEGDALQGHMIRELLGLHEALLVRLRDGKAITAELGANSSTTELLTGLIAEHEKDAFMLRALLWEVQNAA
jgi:starvation-inducible DNA-binding protein